MSAQDDKRESLPQDILKPPLDRALGLGLKPYAEFETKMSPLFERISSDERDRFLRHIYQLAAEKVLIENSRVDAENQARDLEEEATKIQSATPPMENASQQLSEARDALPQESTDRSKIEKIISQLHSLDQSLTERSLKLTRLAKELRNLKGKEIDVMGGSPSSLQYAVQLRRMDEVAPDLPSGEQALRNYISSLLRPAGEAQYRYQFPSGRKMTAVDHWLISAIDKSLPKAPPNKRLRFSRDEVIYMTFEAALGETTRTIDGVKDTRRRKSDS